MCVSIKPDLAQPDKLTSVWTYLLYIMQMISVSIV